VAGLNWLGTTVSSGIRAIFGHRKALHWPLWGLLLALAGMQAGYNWLIWFGLGYALHIAGDALTKSGVPIFGPISHKNISLTPMVTGGLVETAFGAALWLFVGWQLATTFLPASHWLWQWLYRVGLDVLSLHGV